jgi:hypothetical protein
MFGMEISRRQTRLAREAYKHLESNFRSVAFGLRCNQVATARALAEIEESGHYLLRGCRCMAEYGEKIGYCGDEAVMLAAVGRALELRPALREELLTGSLTLEAAAAWGRAADAASAAGNEKEKARAPISGKGVLVRALGENVGFKRAQVD